MTRRTETIEWSEDQVRAIDAVMDALSRGEKVSLLAGAAGCGKTTSAIEISSLAAADGWHVKYLAPTGKAALRISEVVGQPAQTIHSALFRWVSIDKEGRPHFKDPRELGEGRMKTLYIIDEASMVGSSLHRAIVGNLHRGSSVLYLGDPAQLPPVGDSCGPDFDRPTATLLKVHRQGQGDPILDVATRLREGHKIPDEDIEGLDGKHYRRRGGSLAHVATWLVEHIQAGRDAVVLCYSNKARQQINNLVRAQLGHRGQGEIVPGEKLICKMNRKLLSRMNGEIFEVKGVRPFPVRDDGIEIDASIIDTTDGDSMISHPSYIGLDKHALQKLAKRTAHLVNPDLWMPLDYAYALTVHASQGSEYQHVCLVIDSTMRYRVMNGLMSYDMACKILYTGITRAQKTVLVWDAK